MNHARPCAKRRLTLALLPFWRCVSGEAQQVMRGDSQLQPPPMTCPKDGCSDEDQTKIFRSNLEECGVWLAPSSIPGAGIGMYAGRDFEKGEALQASGEVVVPQIDINSHQFELGDRYFFLWDEYTWSGWGLGMGSLGHIEVKVQSPGFGSAANSFIDLINVDELTPQNTMPHGLHRSKDPGAGAFSTFHDRQSIARVPIQRGEELFVDYGERWFIDRPHFGAVPLLGDLDKATELFRSHFELRQRHPGVSSDIFDEIWLTFVEGTEYHESRVMGSFQKTQEEWEQLWNGKSLKEIRIEEGRRTDEWLREHGTCADNIREGESTIRQAGRGAFASRRLVKDSIIAPMPLIHIGDYHILDMYAFEDIRQLKLEPGPRMIGIQLTLNYCFGHKDSTLLLCPYGPLTSLINHNRTQANVRIQWPKTAKGNHDPSLLKRPLEHFAQDKTTKLAMELVANREIMPGEELFLDYGDAWENAWNGYLRKWKPRVGAENYVSALELNASPDPLRTEFEQMEDPYSQFVFLQCNQAFFSTIDFSLFQETGEIKVVDYFAPKWYDCEILRYRFEKNRFLYTAVLILEEGKHDKLVDVPREAVRFMDKPYTSDFLLPDAFRHSMMIPDEMFPEYWMNL